MRYRRGPLTLVVMLALSALLSPKRLSRVLQELREARGLTQAELAKQAKIERTYLTKLETGAKANPTLATLKRLAKALDVPVTALVE
jgi:XRE family transcriptional regulator, regulator of sulfur utilization